MANLSIEDQDLLHSLVQDKCDPSLGLKVKARLEGSGLETPMVEDVLNIGLAIRAFEFGINSGMEALGLNMEDDSLKDTPKRYAAMMVGELTKGLHYNFFPKCTTIPAGHMKDLVVVRNIQVLSLCEHHLQTIDGFAHIAYIPNEKLLGLSKFARITEFFSRRPQVQERLTAQIYEALSEVLETEDIAVVIRATHYCMKARGSLQHASETTTDKMGGKFFTNAALREELLSGL